MLSSVPYRPAPSLTSVLPICPRPLSCLSPRPSHPAPNSRTKPPRSKAQGTLFWSMTINVLTVTARLLPGRWSVLTQSSGESPQRKKIAALPRTCWALLPFYCFILMSLRAAMAWLELLAPSVGAAGPDQPGGHRGGRRLSPITLGLSYRVGLALRTRSLWSSIAHPPRLRLRAAVPWERLLSLGGAGLAHSRASGGQPSPCGRQSPLSWKWPVLLPLLPRGEKGQLGGEPGGAGPRGPGKIPPAHPGGSSQPASLGLPGHRLQWTRLSLRSRAQAMEGAKSQVQGRGLGSPAISASPWAPAAGQRAAPMGRNPLTSRGSTGADSLTCLLPLPENFRFY